LVRSREWVTNFDVRLNYRRTAWSLSASSSSVDFTYVVCCKQ